MQIEKEGRVFEVELRDDGTADTVVAVNGREHRFDSEGIGRDEQTGALLDEELRELGEQVIANMDDEEFKKAPLAKEADIVQKMTKRAAALDWLGTIPDERYYDHVIPALQDMTSELAGEVSADVGLDTDTDLGADLFERLTDIVVESWLRHLTGEQESEIEQPQHTKAEEGAYERAKRADCDSASSEELEAAADKLAELQAQAEAEDLLSTEEREEHDKAILKDIVDRQGVDGVVTLLKDVCELRAEQAKTGEQDKSAAQTYRQMAHKLDEFIGWYYNG